MRDHLEVALEGVEVFGRTGEARRGVFSGCGENAYGGVDGAQNHFLGATARRDDADPGFHQAHVQLSMGLAGGSVQRDLRSSTETEAVGRHDYRTGTEADGGGHALESAHGKVEVFPLPFLNEEQHLEEIGADGKVGAVAGDDEALEVANGIAGGIEDLGYQAGDVFADRVFFRVQLDGRDAVAEVNQRRSGIGFDDAVRFAEVRYGGDTRRLKHRHVFASGGIEDLLAPVAIPAGWCVG